MSRERVLEARKVAIDALISVNDYVGVNALRTATALEGHPEPAPRSLAEQLRARVRVVQGLGAAYVISDGTAARVDP